MNRRTFVGQLITGLPVVVAGLTSLTGCRSSPKPPRLKPMAYHVEFAVERDLSIELDAFAIPQLRRTEWESVDPVTYFSGKGENREQGAVSLRFPGDTPQLPQEKMSAWVARRYTHLVIIADIAAYKGPKERNDRRRLVINLDQRAWQGDTLRIQVNQSGLRLLTDPTPDGWKYTG